MGFSALTDKVDTFADKPIAFIGRLTRRSRVIKHNLFIYLADVLKLIRRTRKPTIFICENKDADELCSNCTTHYRLCFRYSESTIPLLLKTQNFKLPACFCACTTRFGLCRTCSETHIVGFLMHEFINNIMMMRGYS